MKHKFGRVLLVSTLALTALLVSQGIWISKASMQKKSEQKIGFQICFNQSISKLVNESMGKNLADSPFKIEPIDSIPAKNADGKTPKVIDAGHVTADKNVSVMIEDALIVMQLDENEFHLSKLDSLITACVSENGKLVFSDIILYDSLHYKKIDEIKYNSDLFKKIFGKTYTAQRLIKTSDKLYLIKAEYRIAESEYIQNMGIATFASLIASIVIISVLFYLIIILKRRYEEILNMERAFHGAIHDLKSPLAYVYFTLSLLEEKETDIVKKTALSVTADRVTYLTDKIIRMLKSGRNINIINETEKQSVSLYDVLEQIEAEMHTMFPAKKIVFESNMDAEMSLRVLPDLFEASIRIVIENAVRYNSNSPIVEIGAIRDVDKMRITITDNGIGMSKQQLKNIFKPYYTSDTKNGTGIGLYYAQQIVKAHGGIISVESILGKGSTFILTLPILPKV